VNRIAKLIYSGKLPEDGIDAKTAAAVAKKLRSGITEGFGRDFSQIDYTTSDAEMLNNLDRNCYQFSVAKNYQELRDCTNLLKDDNGNVRSFTDFRNEVAKTHKVYSIDWLQTEYNTALNSATLAGKWVEFKKNAEALPYLVYVTAGDKRVRDSHRALDGVQRKLEDDFWKTYYPPNGFNCRCTVNQSGQGSETPMAKVRIPDVIPMFRTNLAQSGLLFPKNHPYFTDIPDNILKHSLNYAPPEIAYRTYKIKSGKEYSWHITHKENKIEREITEFLANKGFAVKILPEMANFPESVRKLHMPEGVKKNKNQDALINKKIFDFTNISGNYTSVQNAMRKLKQADNILIKVEGDVQNKDVLNAAKGRLLKKNSFEIWLLNAGKLTIYKYENQNFIKIK